MVFDVEAPVVFNIRLSHDYNVIGLRAPQIAEHTAPGQFVMAKSGRGTDPLLRRPFSVFEVLRDEAGRTTGLSLLSKRIGPTTSLLYDTAIGETVSCLGPLGRPFVPVSPPAEAWLVAGGVGLAPFATLAQALAVRQTPTTLFYGARRAEDLFYLDEFARWGVRLVLATEDGSRGVHGRVTAPLESALAERDASSAVVLYACGPEPMLAVVARLAAEYMRTIQISVERVMGCGMGGCYSCVITVRDDAGEPHFVRSCLAGPVFRGDAIVWDGHAQG